MVLGRTIVKAGFIYPHGGDTIMGKDPAFLFYPGDWLGGTMGMTLEEKGAYIELLVLQFNRGHLTSHMIGQVVGQLWVTIEDKFRMDDKGLYFNERLEFEKNKRESFITTRKNNLLGKNQYSKEEKKKPGHKGGQMTSLVENENRDRNKDKNIDSFNLFWEKYHQITNMPKTDKKPAIRKWKQLNKTEKNKACENIEKFFNSIKDKSFCKKARTYLEDKNFNDEFVIAINNKSVNYEDNKKRNEQFLEVSNE